MLLAALSMAFLLCVLFLRAKAVPAGVRVQLVWLPFMAYAFIAGVFLVLAASWDLSTWLVIPACLVAIWGENRLMRENMRHLLEQGKINAPPGYAVVPLGKVLVRKESRDDSDSIEVVVTAYGEGNAYPLPSDRRHVHDIWLEPGMRLFIAAGKNRIGLARSWTIHNRNGRMVRRRKWL